jgi:hypothetical protein
MKFLHLLTFSILVSLNLRYGYVPCRQQIAGSWFFVLGFFFGWYWCLNSALARQTLYHLTMPPSPLVIFKIGSCCLPHTAWTESFLFALLCIAGMIGVHHCIQTLFEIVSHELFFVWAGLEL